MSFPEKLTEAALTVKCPVCGVKPGEPCKGAPIAAGVHANRVLTGASLQSRPKAAALAQEEPPKEEQPPEPPKEEPHT